MTALDETHQSDLTSWVDSAQAPATDFPIQNLPFGVFERRTDGGSARIGVAIGDEILDLAACARAGLLSDDASAFTDTFEEGALNALMARGRDAARAIRQAVSALLR